MMARTVLVVDDDQDLRDLVQVALKREGYTVLEAPNAMTAFDIIEAKEVDVALLDIMMPGMDGIELLGKLRHSNNDLPVIMMTAATTPQTAVEAMRGHACDFLAKPFNLDELISSVKTALEIAPREVTIEVLSARPEWIELRVPCLLEAIDPLGRMMLQLKTDLPQATRESVTYAFREMLHNAIEYGGKNDPERIVEVSYLRSPRLIIYRIKDPGEGFTLESLYGPEGPLAAVVNPDSDPARHETIRNEAGIRPGGFGILIASRMVDEMIFNEPHNEVVLIKYLDEAGP